MANNTINWSDPKVRKQWEETLNRINMTGSNLPTSSVQPTSQPKSVFQMSPLEYGRNVFSARKEELSRLPGDQDRTTPAPSVNAPASAPTHPISSVGTSGTTAADIRRDGDSFAVKSSPLDDWKKYQDLKDAALHVMETMQGRNQDLTDATAYWRTIQRDTTSFDDPIYRQMSPSDQTSIRLAREGAAGAHLGAIEQERQYRERLAGTALENIKDIYSLMRDEAKSAQTQANLDRDFRLGLLDAGLGGAQWIDDNGNLTPLDGVGIITYNGDIYNFRRYAVDEEWAEKVQGHLGRLPEFVDYGIPTHAPKSGQYATSFDEYLARTNPNSGLIGYGREIAQIARNHGLPPEILMAVINHESAYGTSPVFKENNNPGGVTWDSRFGDWKGGPRPAKEGGHYVKFPTIAHGISSTALSLANRNRENYERMVFPSTGGTVESRYTDTEIRKLAEDSGRSMTEINAMSDDERVALRRQIEGERDKNAESLLGSKDAKTIMGRSGITESLLKRFIQEFWDIERTLSGRSGYNTEKQNLIGLIDEVYPGMGIKIQDLALNV